MGILGHFIHFWAILTCFLHYSTWTNKKSNNYSFWINFSDLNQIIYSFWFLGIWHYSTFYGESCWIIHFDLLCFDSFYDANNLFLNISDARTWKFRGHAELHESSASDLNCSNHRSLYWKCHLRRKFWFCSIWCAYVNRLRTGNTFLNELLPNEFNYL